MTRLAELREAVRGKFEIPQIDVLAEVYATSVGLSSRHDSLHIGIMTTWTKLVCSVLLILSMGCASLTTRHWSDIPIVEARAWAAIPAAKQPEFNISDDHHFELENLRLEQYLIQTCGVRLMHVSPTTLSIIAIKFMGPDAGRLYGVTSLAPVPIILLDNSLTPSGEFEVLSHEIGHFFMPHTLTSYAQSEVFAELLSYRLLESLGYNNRANAGLYISGYIDGVDEVVKNHLPRLEMLVSTLLPVLTSQHVNATEVCPVYELDQSAAPVGGDKPFLR